MRAKQIATLAVTAIVFGIIGASCVDGVADFVLLDAGGGEGGQAPDAGPDGGDEEDAGKSSSNAGACDFTCDGDCVPLHPGDSSYPVLVWIGPNDGSAPDCPDNAPVEQFVWYTDLVVPPKSCGPCSRGPSFATVPPVPPKPSFRRMARVCEGSAFGRCEPDEHCAPAPPEGFRQCVYAAGEHDCPPESYAERVVVYEGFADERTCPPGACGAPEGDVAPKGTRTLCCLG
ncbi:hypothetical protein [Polyangium sp. 15x6]|uniref:hypothetical protein n=1 Tax=Polyangium sp. 15x6 TaxID=3042687 RepID=UPI00249BCC3B|nr:hypothetical protein [Polyangium sp. 15x6]MDI3281713.1 hypothetical protein [Polyangium sp. 15x6]